MRLVVLIACLLIDAVPGLSQEVDKPTAQVLITVNGMPITVARFKHSYLQRLLSSGDNDTAQNRQAHLENLVATYLMAGEARDRGLDTTENYIEFRDRQFKSAVGGAYFERVIGDSLPPLSDLEVRKAFRNSREDVKLRHLYFRDPNQAQTAYERLQNGEDFVDLANESYKTASYDSTAGSLGFASYWELDDAIALAVFDLVPGQYTRPIRSRHGWHIVRVEDRLVNPILTESEFQMRRQGIEAKARIRRNLVLGDNLVRSIMDSANVQVDRAGMQLAVDAISEITDQRGETKAPRLLASEVNFIRQSLEPETPLMTYTVNGENLVFRATDLYDWLPELEFPELRDKPFAAIGRALRNEVLAKKGIDAGLDDDRQVEETVQFLTNTYLAQHLRENLEPLDPGTISEDRVERAYRELGYRELRSARGDWWQIEFGTLAEADSARHLIESERRRPASFTTYQLFEDGDLTNTELGDYVRRALPDQTMLACTTENRCFVLRVEDVRLEYATLEESEDEIRSRLSEYLPQVNLLMELRDGADVESDSALVDQILNPE